MAKDCRRRFWAPYQKEKTSSHSKIWKKKEVQSEICDIEKYTNMIDLERAESVKLQFSKSHTQVS